MRAYHRMNRSTSLSDLNLSLQARDSYYFKQGDKIRAFMKHLTRWKVRASQERLDIRTELILSHYNFDESAMALKSASKVQFKAT